MRKSDIGINVSIGSLLILWLINSSAHITEDTKSNVIHSFVKRSIISDLATDLNLINNKGNNFSAVLVHGNLV
jgi:hypothetical protein